MSRRTRKTKTLRQAAKARLIRYRRAEYFDCKPVRRLTPIRPNVTESKALIVTGEFTCGVAHWQKIYGVWSCTDADPSLKWMIGKTPANVQLELLKLGVSYRWDGPVNSNDHNASARPGGINVAGNSGTSSSQEASVSSTAVEGAPTRPNPAPSLLPKPSPVMRGVYDPRRPAIAA